MVTKKHIRPETVLSKIYGKSSLELKMSEKRRDEVIAAAIFTSFRNQEYGTKFQFPADYKEENHEEDARGIDMVVYNAISGRSKKLQIKGVYIRRSIERRRLHKTKGVAQLTGRKCRRLVEENSEELREIMKEQLEKILHHDYSGIILIIHVVADLATQTSLEIAIKKCRPILEKIKAKEIWILRNIPIHVIHQPKEKLRTHSFRLIQVSPYPLSYTYTFSF